MDPSKSVPETTVDAQLLELMLRVGSRWVLWLLLALSLAAVAVMIERVWFFIQERRPSDALDKALTALRKDGPAAAVVHLRGCRSMEAAVTLASLEHADDGAEAVEEHIAATVESERLRYERGLAFLGTLGSNAPFIGLFGTVLGIIRAFHDLAANTAQGAQAVMAGIAEALVATAVGLLVALPAVAMYNTLARHVETAASAAGAMGHAILAVVKAVPRDKKPREVA
jgi:biopolymer transport protein ExbB/TolQ